MTARGTSLLLGAATAAVGAGCAAIEGLGAAGAACAAVAGAALAAADRRPRAAWPVAVAALGAAAPLGVSWTMLLLAAAHAFVVARREPRWAALAALAALVAALELAVLLDGDSPVPALLVPAAAWAAGSVLRERELVAALLVERARELAEEREAHAALSVRYERARIASELHDIVAHAISVMVVQAGAGQRIATRDPEATTKTFVAIAGAARQAEADMGRLIALLGGEAAIDPGTDLQLVEELVARAAGSGLDVTLHMEGERDGLTAPLAGTAYRVVQEGLTNALRYASGAAVSVLVRGAPGALVVAVENAPATHDAALAGAGTGHGLQGLRERVAECGGTLEAGPTPAGGWRLAARLPGAQR